jgi:hypothetical protein
MEAEPTVCLLSLPPAVAQRIFALLPEDLRARCAAVCRGWRELLADPSLWTRLDLSCASGISRRLTAGVLCGAAARAGGALETLDISGANVPFEMLLEVVTANAGTLRELRPGRFHESVEELTALLCAAPALRKLTASAYCLPEQARALLHNATLRLQKLSVISYGNQELNAASVLDLAAALPTHASLRGLVLDGVLLIESDSKCATLVDASLAAQLSSLELSKCGNVAPTTASALARLLHGGMLRELRLNGCRGLFDDRASTAVLAAALERSTSLTDLSLISIDLWSGLVPGALLLGALVAHPSLRMLSCCLDPSNDPEAVAAAGAAFGALVAANAPALILLNLSCIELHHTMLGPLFDALPCNTHLRCLDVSLNGICETFAAERVLPAVRANTTLLELQAYEDVPTLLAPSLYEAVRLVSNRTRLFYDAAAASKA